jgi:hypothetical protein
MVMQSLNITMMSYMGDLRVAIGSEKGFLDPHKLWVPVSSTGKVSCRRTRDLGSNPAYTKNQLVSWPDVKSNHHERTP